MFYGDLPVDYGVFIFFSSILWFWGGGREISIFVCPIKLLRFPVIRVGRHFILDVDVYINCKFFYNREKLLVLLLFLLNSIY